MESCPVRIWLGIKWFCTIEEPHDISNCNGVPKKPVAISVEELNNLGFKFEHTCSKEA